MTTHSNVCIWCEEDGQSIPLISFQFQGVNYWICAQHFPILIHHTDQLADKLPDIQPGIIAEVDE